MDSGKALARSGELLIEATSTPEFDCYGGGLSAAGANIRNAGDCVAQAAASCRFKTAAEYVCDEMREGATCLIEGVEQLKKAMDDAEVDEKMDLKDQISNIVPHMLNSGTTLEAAGAGIMKRETVIEIGTQLVECSVALESFALGIQQLPPSVEETKVSGQRMLYAAEKMKEAGNNLMGVQPEKKKGKSWLKG